MKKNILYLLVFLLAFSLTILKAQTTFTVNDLGDGIDANLGDGVCADANGNCTLRAAIQEAQSGALFSTTDKIVFEANLSGVININSPLNIDNFINTISTDIEGPGAEIISIDGGGTSELLMIKNGSVSGLKLTNGLSNGGTPAINIIGGGDATFNAVIIQGNTGTMGPIHMNSNGTLNIYNSLIIENSGANNSGALKLNGGTTNVINSTIANNSALFDGGGIQLETGNPTLNLSNSIVASNTVTIVPANSGDINVKNGTLMVAGANLVGDNRNSTLTADGILIGTPNAPIDPLLDGTTYALLDNSPALDAGSDVNIPPSPFDQTDLADNDRILGQNVDLGALESVPLITEETRELPAFPLLKLILFGLFSFSLAVYLIRKI